MGRLSNAIQTRVSALIESCADSSDANAVGIFEGPFAQALAVKKRLQLAGINAGLVEMVIPELGNDGYSQAMLFARVSVPKETVPRSRPVVDALLNRGITD